MPRADATPSPADAGAPRVELSRTKDGTHTWRVVVQADDSAEVALMAAKNVAIAIDRALAAQYDAPPS